MTLADEILRLIAREPGLTDREITNRLRGASAMQQPINQQCRALEATGRLLRRERHDGRIGNYPTVPSGPVARVSIEGVAKTAHDPLAEDSLKQVVKDWLEADGWTTQVAWKGARGADIVARRGDETWIIEVKGRGSLQPMRVNYFLAILGETLQRMSDPSARYSIALPDLAQFRGLWERLPSLAKERTTISALFVSDTGIVSGP